MIGIETDKGTELLIHIGIDTVKLNGKYFTVHVNENDTVKKGDLLVEFDKAQVEKEGFDTVIPVIVTNLNEAGRLVKINDKSVIIGEKVFSIE